MIKKPWILFMIFLSFCGIIFIGLIAHELTHVIQSKDPISICYDFQQASVAHVKHNISNGKFCEYDLYKNSTMCNEDRAFNNFNSYTEKWAYLIQDWVIYVLFFLLGVGVMAIERKRE